MFYPKLKCMQFNSLEGHGLGIRGGSGVKITAPEMLQPPPFSTQEEGTVRVPCSDVVAWSFLGAQEAEQ